MGAFLDKPKTQKISEEGSRNELKFGVACMQGWRIDMEDAHRIVFPLPGKLADWSFYAIFDGHAGSKVAENASKTLIDVILARKEFQELQNDSSRHSDKDLIRRGIVQGFLDFDDTLEKDERSGSTAITAFVTPKHIILGNCGDSRAMVVSKQQVVQETVDHKPADEKEAKRIKKAGGEVVLQRINGALAVSRSLGDFEYKRNTGLENTEQLVSAEPEVTFYERRPDEDQILFLACDGIWDVFSSDILKNYLIHRLSCEESFARITEQLLDHCLHLGSRDNMSALLVGLDSCPKVDPEMKKKDDELNKSIATLAHNHCTESSKSETFSSNQIFELIKTCDLDVEGLPGGLISKRYIIESVFNKFNPNSDESSPEVIRLAPTNYGLGMFLFIGTEQ
ncbi:Protein phosphatase 1A [Cichlidogyrus casuarinus]|uniref:Protein phosphatase 1A n=1 Tax=Cichlidogyrus casuarinus TaxID=1844966 RepID=A0ABD2QHX4_9PLAT